jgi:hypothetical protein
LDGLLQDAPGHHGIAKDTIPQLLESSGTGVFGESNIVVKLFWVEHAFRRAVQIF